MSLVLPTGPTWERVKRRARGEALPKVFDEFCGEFAEGST